ncbi:MAG: hypothetical protein CSA79_03985 [Thiothrix nivea]|nr:MAG: hypothetical protein CSA79_03985 [Thiothrix nivea]
MQVCKRFKQTVIAGQLALLLGVMSTPALADDVTDSIQEATKAYEAGDIAGAVEGLNYAVQLLQQMKGKVLAKLLPEPLEGWKAGEAESAAVGAAMFGGGLTAQRDYQKDKSRVKIQVVTDSPMLQGMMTMFSNPMFAASSGGKMTRINKQKAIVEYDSERQEGEIQIMVKNRYMVTVSGNKVSKDELKAYVDAIDFSKFAD